MRCQQAALLLSANQDGRLSPQESSALHDHLEGCPHCQKEAQRLSSAWNQVCVLEPIQPSAEFRARFWARARSAAPEPHSRWAGFAPFWEAFQGVRPAFALSSILAASILGAVIALKVLPSRPAAGGHSPLLQWAQSGPADLIGGF